MPRRPEVTIYIGDVHISRTPALVKTLVGSCIAACLIDPVARVGGMSHFILPSPGGELDGSEPCRFGVHAMDVLIGGMQKAGADRRRLSAKLFGGAHVLPVPRRSDGVPERNIRFIEMFLEGEGIPVASRDLGGYLPRRVLLQTDSGTVYVRRLAASVVRQMRFEERAHLTMLGRRGDGDDVTLFDTGGDR